MLVGWAGRGLAAKWVLSRRRLLPVCPGLMFSPT
jgi:hypothetical protein